VKLERDEDPKIDAKARVTLFGVLLACSATCTLLVQWYGQSRVGIHQAILIIVGIDLVLVTTIVSRRERFMSTRIGRLGAGALLLWGFSTLGHRLLAAAVGTPLHEVLSVDLWTTAVIIVALTLALGQRFWLAATVGVTAAVLAAVLPHLALAIYSGSSILLTGLLLYAGVRLVKER
jgi:hypothetical protein